MRALSVALWIAVPLVAATALSDLRLVRVLELRSPTDHVQGIDFDNRRLWVTSVNTQKRTGALEEFSKTFRHALFANPRAGRQEDGAFEINLRGVDAELVDRAEVGEMIGPALDATAAIGLVGR